VLGLAVCAFNAAGHDSPVAIAEWAAGCSQGTLALLGGRRDPWTRRIRPPSTRTFSRVFGGIGAEAFNAALYGYLAALPATPPAVLPPVTLHEREQRRAAAKPGAPGLLEQAADGKTVRGAIRPDGSQVHLLSVLDVGTGRVRAQREIDVKTSEIPELAPAIAHLDLIGQLVTLDALHTQAEIARHLVEDKHAHYLMIIKGNQPSLLAATAQALAGPDSCFTAASWAEEETVHGRRERRSIRTATADDISWPHAAQVMRIHRDTGPAHGPWMHKEIAYGITSLPRTWPDPPPGQLRPAALGHREPRAPSKQDTMTFYDLAAAMRVWAKGLPGLEAAVELLIGHGTWPARADFAEVALTPGRDGITGTEMASVDFEAALAARRAGGLPCSSGEDRVLALAASIATGVPVALGDLVSGLDEDNAVRVAIAVLHAAGFGGRSVLVTRGRQGGSRR
jgi:predicted transposase YbfD/YdcC